MQMIKYFRCYYEEVTIYRKGWQVQNFGQKQHGESWGLFNFSSSKGFKL